MSTPKFLTYTVYLLKAVQIIILLLLPIQLLLVLQILFNGIGYEGSETHFFISHTVSLFVFSLFALILLYVVYRIEIFIKDIKASTVFKYDHVRAMRKAALWLGATPILLKLISSFTHIINYEHLNGSVQWFAGVNGGLSVINDIFSLGLVAGLLSISILFLLIAELIRQGIGFKEESDLTI